jgi:hypothetical protein
MKLHKQLSDEKLEIAFIPVQYDAIIEKLGMM